MERVCTAVLIFMSQDMKSSEVYGIITVYHGVD
jgi:hypothetical protein